MSLTLLKVSVAIPTRDRPKDLAELLVTLLDQSQLPQEVIIIDDSQSASTKEIAHSFASKFESVGCMLKHIQGSGDGLTAARNLSVKTSRGGAILFLDDDTLLNRNVVSALATFLKDNIVALGVQPKILPSAKNLNDESLTKKLGNALYKVLMLTYRRENKLAVRRSGASVFPESSTEVINAQRLSGCSCCYRREVFSELSFDTSLKRWGSMEDLEFSYNVYKKNPWSLYVIPYAKVVHKACGEARLPTKLNVYMATIYWFYVFFKDIFEGSVPNLIAFLWALTGNLVTVLCGLIVKRKKNREWWGLIYLLGSYITAFRNLKNILMLRLEFFNRNL